MEAVSLCACFSVFVQGITMIMVKVKPCQDFGRNQTSFHLYLAIFGEPFYLHLVILVNTCQSEGKKSNFWWTSASYLRNSTKDRRGGILRPPPIPSSNNINCIMGGEKEIEVATVACLPLEYPQNLFSQLLRYLSLSFPHYFRPRFSSTGE